MIKQFETLIDKTDLNTLKFQGKIKNEITRFKKFQKSLLNQKTDIRLEDIDIRNYTKFIFKDGSTEEKREILSSFENKLVLEKREIKIK